MQINVRYLENLRLEASFDDFKVIADQPIRYKGDGTAPGPFDYFLASSALCAAYFVKVYCNAREIPTDEIKITQNNIVDPENRYQQSISMVLEVPESISKKDTQGMIKAMDRCSVKRVIQNSPEFKITAKVIGAKDISLDYQTTNDTKTMILGKDSPLEDTILKMSSVLSDLGIDIEIASWRNPVPHVWSVHIRDKESPMCFTNGKGATKDAALCSALGEYIERISSNYFYNDFYLGQEVSTKDFVHYPNEKWFKLNSKKSMPQGLMDEYLLNIYDNDGELLPTHLIDTNSGNIDRGICALPYIRQSDKKEIFIPVNLIGNLFVSNGMSAGNTLYEARVQALSEIFERAVKNKIITEEITLPDVPSEVLTNYPTILEGINKLEESGFPVIIKDASLGGKFPVICVAIMIPETGGVFASFGAHPKFEVALERSLTELLQGRSFEGLKDLPSPTFNSFAISESNNIIDHFIDSSGVISWKFFKDQSDFDFVHWNLSGSTQEEFNYLMGILKQMDKEVYIADFNDLGANACRILVPDYSEIYPLEDLVWDNHNQALIFRQDILNIHQLDQKELLALSENLEESEIDNQTLISEIIGVSFDENSVWGQLSVGELKGLIYLSLKDYEQAKEMAQMFLAFNDNLPERKKFYQAVNTILDITIDKDSKIEDYQLSLEKMYGKNCLDNAIKTVNGQIKFFGLTPTDMNLKNIDKHERLVKSYLKLHKKRSEKF